MKITENLLFVSHMDRYLIYNGEIHSALMVSGDIYNYIRENKYFYMENVSNEEIDDLIFHGIIYEDIDDYNDLKKRALEHLPIVPNLDFTPRFAYIQVTKQCNLRCSYCYNRENLCQVDKTDKKNILSILDKLKESGVKTVILTGGEPLARSDIEEIVDYAKSLSFYVQILSNGTLFMDNLNVLNKADGIITSIDTFNPLHNERLGLKIEDMKTDLINLPKDIRDKTIIRSVVGSKHPDDWKEVRDFSERNDYSFMYTVMMPYGVHEFKNIPSLKDVEEVPEDYREPIGCNSCGAAKGIIAIDGDGNVYPCQAMIRKEMILSNIFLKNWKEVLMNRRREKQIDYRSVDTADKCKNCNVKYICGGGCMAVSYDCYNDISKTVSPLCKFKREEAIQKLKGILEIAGGKDD